MSTAEETPKATDSAAAGDDLAQLLGRVAARDAAAFATLYRATHAVLYGVVARILTRGDASGEALQEAYVRIWEKAGEFDLAKGSPLAWMATIARNRALDEVRRIRPTSLEEMPLACLGALDADKREAVLLAYYRGFSRDALARRFGAPTATIKTWLRRSLMQLRDCLES